MKNNYILLLIVMWFAQLQCMDQSKAVRYYIPAPQSVSKGWYTSYAMAVIAAKEDPRHRSNLNVIGPKEYKNKTVSKLDFFECDPAALELYFTRDMSEDQKAKFKLSPRELSQKEYFELVRIIRPDYPLPKNYDQVVKVVSQ